MSIKHTTLHIAFFSLMISTVAVSAQIGGRTEKQQIKLPALLMPNPVIQWVKYEANPTAGGKTMTAGITFAVTNWDKYAESLFAKLDAKPPCSNGKSDSRMIMELFDNQTDKVIDTNCSVDAAGLKTNTLYIQPENKVPACVYAVLTDRQSGRKAKSNPMDVKGGKVCFKGKNDTDAPGGGVIVVTPKP